MKIKKMFLILYFCDKIVDMLKIFKMKTDQLKIKH